MDNSADQLAKVERSLIQARQVLSTPVRYQPEEWMLLATLFSGADLIIREAREHDPDLQIPLFEIVMQEFREATSNFTNVDFLRSSRAARRDNPALFSSRS